MSRKIFRAAATLIVVLNLLTAGVHAEIVTYTGEGVYFLADEVESTLDDAKTWAELDALRLIAEEICAEIKEESKVHNNRLSYDEIVVVSESLLHVVTTEYEFEDAADGLLIKAFVTATIDTDELKRVLDEAADS